ncbi:MAG TPA: glucose-6-phosphate isomerase [Verrucomicrobiae bacterium]
MIYSKQQLWQRFQQHYSQFPEIGFALDLSRLNFPDDYYSSIAGQLKQAFDEMDHLERGAVANKDEGRMVGHYWLRNPALAPNPAIRQAIEQTLADIKTFTAEVHAGRIHGAAGPFKNLLVVGIGGSALGPQFVANALGRPGKDNILPFFLDNTDPDGIDKILTLLQNTLGRTLVVVISKSGGTKETRNGMLETQAAYQAAGLNFANHAVAITKSGSELDKLASAQRWIRRFPMWDWVGGRTSELSAVGLLPAALQGFDIDAMLAGAKTCDELTRRKDVKTNPAAQLALMWHYIGNGKGSKNMIILPYKDRLDLFSKYLQQLVMESLGKELDRDGNTVRQGITVLGNKGSTDQHSYVQQLRDGLDNFFVIFIEVLRDRLSSSMEVEPGITTGDYLDGFLLGTRSALYENGRESITLTIQEVSAFSVGALIALFERTVGLYASIINVNAYHQPGVEAGKKAASTVIALQLRVMKCLSGSPQRTFTAEEIAATLGLAGDAETVFKICEHLAGNPDRKTRRTAAESAATARYQKVG